MTASLNQNLEKDPLTQFGALSANELKTMHELQRKLVSLPILALPYTRGRYTIDTVAYNVQVGCVLVQGQPDGTIKQVEHWSRSFTKAEKAYNKSQRE